MNIKDINNISPNENQRKKAKQMTARFTKPKPITPKLTKPKPITAKFLKLKPDITDVTHITEEEFQTLLSCYLLPKLTIPEAIKMAKGVMKAKGIPVLNTDATYKKTLNKWRENNYDIWAFIKEGIKAWTDRCSISIKRRAAL